MYEIVHRYKCSLIFYTPLCTHIERKEGIEEERDREKDSKRDNIFSRFIFYF